MRLWHYWLARAWC